MMQIWFCELCRVEGRVPLKEHVDVWTATSLIEANHGLRSAICHTAYGIRGVRVRSSICTDNEWLKLKNPRKPKKPAVASTPLK
jgi:hypothetical protein